jgi:class 3 adenylate cyclase
LTTTLNTYLSKIVQVILEAGGDVLKFAGDALLAFWSCSRFSIAGMLDHVLTTCLSIQNQYGSYRTEDGDNLRMKIGLSIGNVELHYIGNRSLRLFDVTGQAIEDSNIAQSHTKSGQMVVSKVAWECMDKTRCATKLVGPGYAQVAI